MNPNSCMVSGVVPAVWSLQLFSFRLRCSCKVRCKILHHPSDVKIWVWVVSSGQRSTTLLKMTPKLAGQRQCIYYKEQSINEMHDSEHAYIKLWKLNEGTEDCSQLSSWNQVSLAIYHWQLLDTAMTVPLKVTMGNWELEGTACSCISNDRETTIAYHLHSISSPKCHTTC